MARGKSTDAPGAVLTDAQKEAINSVIASAEQDTGLEICLILGSKIIKDARTDAEHVFLHRGLHQRPGVLVVVVPPARTVEVVVAAGLADRLTDNDCDEAVRLMTGSFATGDTAGGIERGIVLLAERAGAGRGPVHSEGDMPNVVDLDDHDK